MTGKIYIIGIGPGSSEYLTKKAIDTVKMSEYTVGSTRAIELFGDVKNTIPFNVKELLDTLERGVQLAVDGNVVSILSTGDPGFSGVLNTVLRISDEKNFPKEDIEVIPGISSLQLAAAKCHIQWDNANVMTFHGRENIEDILPVINNGKITIALPSRKVKDMAQFLLDNGVEADRKVTVCERLSYPDEKIVHSTMDDIANSEFTYMCIIVIYPQE
ncbi:cobalt-precorrin-7 (C(5))-methyltransferase [Methanobrevibacter sp.]